ncbi:MAG: hypothetical protein L7G92_05325, partial [Stygiolobus sp.]|nr:hypothetical protein [Stygiolobus sp.]
MESKVRIDTFSIVMRELEKEKYHLVGSHSVYKKCHWTHEALTSNRYCYKGKFLPYFPYAY